MPIKNAEAQQNAFMTPLCTMNWSSNESLWSILALSFQILVSLTRTEWTHFLLISSHVRTGQRSLWLQQVALNELCTSEAQQSVFQTDTVSSPQTQTDQR